jgi:hypothetical protein
LGTKTRHFRFGKPPKLLKAKEFAKTKMPLWNRQQQRDFAMQSVTHVMRLTQQPVLPRRRLSAPLLKKILRAFVDLGYNW